MINYYLSLIRQFKGAKVILVPLCCLLFFTACRQENATAQEPLQSNMIQVTDAQGNQVVLTQPAKRIVALIPHATDMLVSVGAAEQLVGVAAQPDMPEQLKDVTVVGRYHNINLEMVLAQKPDLVIAWVDGSPPADIQKLKVAKIPVYVSNPMQLEDVAKEVMDMGTLTGNAKIAQKNAQQFLDDLVQIKAQYQNKTEVSVFIQLGNNPVYTVGNSSFLGKLLQYCHASNVFTDAKQPAFKVNEEQVVKANPQVIILMGDEDIKPLSIWKKWPIRAQQKQHLYPVPENRLSRPSLDILPDLRLLCERIDRAR